MRFTSSAASVVFAFLLPNWIDLILWPCSASGLDSDMKNVLFRPGAWRKITSQSRMWAEASSMKSIMCYSSSRSFSRRIWLPTLLIIFFVLSEFSYLPPDFCLITYLLSLLVITTLSPYITCKQNFPPWHRIMIHLKFSFLSIYIGSKLFCFWDCFSAIWFRSFFCRISKLAGLLKSTSSSKV